MCRRPVALFTPEKSANFVLKFRLIAETSNSRNVHPVSVTFRLFVYSATCRNDGKAFRRQNVSAATFFAVSSARCDRIGPIMRCDARFGDSAATFFAVSSARCDRIGPIMRCDARFGDSAAYPRRRKARKQAKIAETAKRSGRLENILNVRYCGVPRGTSISCSTWNADKLLSFNNLCKNVQNVRMIRSTYSDYKLLITSNLTF